MKYLIRHNTINNHGFSMIELVVVMAISSIVMLAIYSIYESQHRSHLMQQELVATQQNLRTAIYYMETEIRLAGCDPTGNAGAQIIDANSNQIRFTADILQDPYMVNEYPDGVINDPNTAQDWAEDIRYSLSDGDNDGDNDLMRNSSILAENICALNFVYLDENGNVTTQVPDIRSVQISIVGRVSQKDPDYTNNNNYYNQQGAIILAAQNDHFKRKVLRSEVKCRNLGLNN